MKKAIKKKAYELYEQGFKKDALKETYEEKISSSRAVGIDGIRQEGFKRKLGEEIELIRKKVANSTYKFTKFKQKLISKGPEKHPRVISIPTIRDRLTLRVVNDILARVFEDARLPRPHVFIKKIQDVLKTPVDNLAFVRMDVHDFYPSVDHKILIRKIRRKVRKKELVYLIQQAISTQTVGVDDKGKGIPQGLSISNILSSIYLLGPDQKFKTKYQYFRYVDDILVLCPFAEAEAVFKEIRTTLEHLGLECHELGEGGKSRITIANKGIDYLGFRITPTMISVRDSSYRRMFENLLAVFTNYKHALGRRKNEDKLIWNLNLKITGCTHRGKRYGWLFFFSQINDLSQPARLDRFVDAQLEKRRLKHLRPHIKRFLKAYHEIRFNFDKTSYFPKFDDYTIAEKINALAQAEGNPKEDYEIMSEAEINALFDRLVTKHVRKLEKDLIDITY